MRWAAALACALAACAPRSSLFPVRLCGTGPMSPARARRLRAAAMRVGLSTAGDATCAEAANVPPAPAMLPVFDPRDGRPVGAMRLGLQSYCALLDGVGGLFYSVPAQKDEAPPEQWIALRLVAEQMSALQQILTGGRAWAAPFGPLPEGLRARAWRYHGRDYVIVADLGRDSLKIPVQLLEPRWRLLFQRRRDVQDVLPFAGDGWYMAPFQVLVFESRPSLFGLSF